MKQRYRNGQIIEGIITGIQPYGAFLSLEDGSQGLIHISTTLRGKIDQTKITKDHWCPKILLGLKPWHKNYQSGSMRRRI